MVFSPLSTKSAQSFLLIPRGRRVRCQPHQVLWQIHFPTIIKTIEVTPALVVLDGLSVHELLEVYPSGRHDDLNVICEVFGEILSGQGRTWAEDDEGFTDRFQLGEYLFQFRERRVGTYVVEVVCVCEKVCILMDDLESQTSQHLA